MSPGQQSMFFFACEKRVTNSRGGVAFFGIVDFSVFFFFFLTDEA